MKKPKKSAVAPSKLSCKELRQNLLRSFAEEGVSRAAPLPSIRETAAKFGVTRSLAERAIRGLVQEGVLRAEHGRGLFLAADGKDLVTSATVGAVFGHSEYAYETQLFQRRVYEGFRSVMVEENYNILSFHNWAHKSALLQRRELALHAAGLQGVALLEIYNDDACLLFRDSGLPVVVLDYDAQPLGMNCVVLDCFDSTLGLVRELARAGANGRIHYADLVYLSDPAHALRKAATEQGAAELGVPFTAENLLVMGHPGTKAELAAIVKSMRASRKAGKRDAVVCYDYSVVPRLAAQLAEEGLAPERDYLLGYSGPVGLPEESRRTPALLAAFDFFEMGRLGGELLLSSVQSGGKRAQRLVLPARIARVGQEGGT
jgi:DNA-binding LacI/PurR family transcriptional regulator